MCTKKHSFWILGRHPSARNPPLTVIKMVHITITSFHINLHTNKSYLLDVDSINTAQIQNPGKYTVFYCNVVYLLPNSWWHFVVGDGRIVVSLVACSAERRCVVRKRCELQAVIALLLFVRRESVWWVHIAGKMRTADLRICGSCSL